MNYNENSYIGCFLTESNKQDTVELPMMFATNSKYFRLASGFVLFENKDFKRLNIYTFLSFFLTL